MRRLAYLMLLSVAGCAASTTAPSLAPRPAEAIDPRVPIPDMIVSADVSLGLSQQLEALVAQAVNGDEAFRAAAENAERLASAAGAPQSESWVLAQQALSVAVAAREPVTRALGEIDSLASTRIKELGGISSADLQAINAAAARVAEIDAREAAVIERLQAQIRG
jgi:hypothetical protein